MIPILINNRDLLYSVQEQLRYFCPIPGTYVCLGDNFSTYPPTVRWLTSLAVLWEKHDLIKSGILMRGVIWDDGPVSHRFTLFKFNSNQGPRAMQQVLRLLPDYRFYFMCDPDIDFRGISPRFLDDLCWKLKADSDLDGTGISLKINDLPKSALAAHVFETEKTFVPTEMGGTGPFTGPSNWIAAGCDTAGVMRRKSPPWLGGYVGTRSLIHVGRHRPWYFVPDGWKCPDCGSLHTRAINYRTDTVTTCQSCVTAEITPDDFAYFYEHANPHGTNYTARVIDKTRPLW